MSPCRSRSDARIWDKKNATNTVNDIAISKVGLHFVLLLFT